mmetsp:Transcript_17192/g.55033  ORF Transcript_17192/g.55033 Transcript_17192/m.55033 type:complete len:299 (-) Transcript_17192:305-1201(-)
MVGRRHAVAHEPNTRRAARRPARARAPSAASAPTRGGRAGCCVVDRLEPVVGAALAREGAERHPDHTPIAGGPVEGGPLEARVGLRDVDDRVGERVDCVLPRRQRVHLAPPERLSLLDVLPARHHRCLGRVGVVGEDGDERPPPGRRVREQRRQQQLRRRRRRVAPEPKGAKHCVEPALLCERREAVQVLHLVDGRRRAWGGLPAERERVAEVLRPDDPVQLARRRRPLLAWRPAAEEQRGAVALLAQLEEEAEQPQVGADRLEVVLVDQQHRKALPLLAPADGRASTRRWPQRQHPA